MIGREIWGQKTQISLHVANWIHMIFQSIPTPLKNSHTFFPWNPPVIGSISLVIYGDIMSYFLDLITR